MGIVHTVNIHPYLLAFFILAGPCNPGLACVLRVPPATDIFAADNVFGILCPIIVMQNNITDEVPVALGMEKIEGGSFFVDGQGFMHRVFLIFRKDQGCPALVFTGIDDVERHIFKHLFSCWKS